MVRQGAIAHPVALLAPTVAVKNSVLPPFCMVLFSFDLLAAFTFVSSERKAKSQIQCLYYSFSYRPEAFAKFRDSNKFCLSDWPSLIRFEKKISHAKNGRHEQECKVNDVAKCCKVIDIFTFLK